MSRLSADKQSKIYDLFAIKKGSVRKVMVVRRTAVQGSMFSIRVRERRQELGLTQHDVSKAVGWSRAQVANFETARSMIPLDKFVKLCQVLQTTPNELLAFKEKP